MSHVATINIAIKSLEALRTACKKLGLQFNVNQKTHRWYGRWVKDYEEADAAYLHGVKPEDYGKCDHAISIPDNEQAYEVGVVRNPTGDGWMLVYDFYQGGYGMTERVGGKNCELLAHEYAAAVAEMETQALQDQGWVLQRVDQPNGDTQIILERD